MNKSNRIGLKAFALLTATATTIIIAENQVNNNDSSLIAEINVINEEYLKYKELSSSNEFFYSLEEEDNLISNDSFLGEYITLEEDGLIIFDVPSIVINNLNMDLQKDLEIKLQEVNDLLTQAYVAIENIDYTELLNIQPTLTRGFSIDAMWVQAPIDIAFVLVTGAIAVARKFPFIGKKMAIKIIREFIPQGIIFLGGILATFQSIAGNIATIFSVTKDDILLRWFSIGGIIANVIDMFDKDGLNGKITF